jgi:hypothetical protein
VFGGVRGVDVHGDEPHVWILELGLGRSREIRQPCTQAKHDVGRECDPVRRQRAGDTNAAETERVRLEQGALAGLGHRDGNASRFGELLDCGAGVRIVHAATGDEQRALGGAQQRGGRAELFRPGRRSRHLIYALGKKMDRTVEGLGLHVLGQSDRDGTGLGRIREHAHGLGHGGEDLFRPVDAVPVARDRLEAVVDAGVLRAGVLELLQHGRGPAVGEDVSRQKQHGQPVDGRGGGAGHHVGRSGADRRRARQRAEAALRFRVGNRRVDHGLLILRLVVRQGAAAVLLEGLAEPCDIAVAENSADTVDQTVLAPIAADVLHLKKADESGANADADRVSVSIL